jgi:hypothetical protein
MKRSFTLLLTLAVGLWISSLSAAGQRRPASTGIEHAETTASTNGQRGIDKAEAKQSVRKHAKKAKVKKAGKKLAKGKNKSAKRA